MGFHKAMSWMATNGLLKAWSGEPCEVDFPTATSNSCNHYVQFFSAAFPMVGIEAVRSSGASETVFLRSCLKVLRLYPCNLSELLSMGSRALHLTPAYWYHLGTCFTVGYNNTKFILCCRQEVIGLHVTKGDNFGKDNVTRAEAFVSFNLVLLCGSNIFLPYRSPESIPQRRGSNIENVNFCLSGVDAGYLARYYGADVR